MVENWKNINEVKDEAFSGEIIPSALSIVAGKSITLDCLSFVRQIHDTQFYMPDAFDWITTEKWQSSYRQFLAQLSEAIASADKISTKEAENFAKRALWAYLMQQLALEYNRYFPKEHASSEKYIKQMRSKISIRLPLLKTFYRKILKKQTNGVRDIHFEVTQKSSKYYQDFKYVADSFSGKN